MTERPPPGDAARAPRGARLYLDAASAALGEAESRTPGSEEGALPRATGCRLLSLALLDASLVPVVGPAPGGVLRLDFPQSGHGFDVSRECLAPCARARPHPTAKKSDVPNGTEDEEG